ncbi:MAG TPA: transposase [Saprospiraceae bacterium]|nr:transposase [Saprospiraceae bacterium]HMQ81521.1 transposase [Saprospiraceae bacterium]
MEKRKIYTAEEKQNIILELKASKFKKEIIVKYKIHHNTLSRWEKEFEKSGLDGLDKKKRNAKNAKRIAILEKKLIVTEESLKYTELELEIRKKLMNGFEESLPIKERLIIVEQYIGKGIKREALLEICKVTEYQWKKHKKNNQP